MISRIQNCYDSHTHFLATGQVAEGLRLHELKSTIDVAHLEIKPTHYRSKWLVGFGWDQNNWPSAKLPTKYDLDAFFPNQPVFFSRADGHASWLNSVGLIELQNLGFAVGEEAMNTGLLFERDHFKALQLLPTFTRAQKKHFFQSAQKIFNHSGFTHIRDLSMTLDDYDILNDLHEQKSLTLCVDIFVTARTFADLDNVLSDLNCMKKRPSPYLRANGVKIFMDGSLGSKTAYLSENYLQTSNRGNLLWTADEIKGAMRKTWGLGFELALHTIGDEAAHVAVQAGREISAEGILGRLHLEHVEVLRADTIQMMKPLHVFCHLQPSHWISDHTWLNKVLSPNLTKNIFPWELLRKNKIPFFFGSDSPIQMPSLTTTETALALSSQNGVPQLNDDWRKYHAHPDPRWTSSYTEFTNGKISQVYFNNAALI